MAGQESFFNIKARMDVSEVLAAADRVAARITQLQDTVKSTPIGTARAAAAEEARVELLNIGAQAKAQAEYQKRATSKQGTAAAEGVVKKVVDATGALTNDSYAAQKAMRDMRSAIEKAAKAFVDLAHQTAAAATKAKTDAVKAKTPRADARAAAREGLEPVPPKPKLTPEERGRQRELDAAARARGAADPIVQAERAAAKQALKNARAEADLSARSDPGAQDQIVANRVRLAKLTAEENGQVLANLEADGDYGAAAAQAVASEKRLAAALNARVQRELAGSDAIPGSDRSSARYISNLGQAAANEKRISTRSGLVEAEILSADKNYAQQRGQLAAALQGQKVREELATEGFLAADRTLASETGKLAAIRRSREVKERQAFLASQLSRGDITEEGRLAFREDFQKSAVGAARVAARAEDPLLASLETNNEAAAAADDYRRSVTKRAKVAEINARHETEIQGSLASARVAEIKRKFAVDKIVRETLGTAFLEEEAREAVAQSAYAERKRALVLEATLAQDRALLDTKAQNVVQTKLLQQRERAAAHVALQEQIKAGVVPRGSFVQRVQAATAARSGNESLRLPTDFATGPQLLRGSLVTTARFAASGALLYGGFTAISKAVKDAGELEKIFNQIRRQFESLGKANEFEGFRTSILAIARDTGSAAVEVANVGFQLQGAFGGDAAKALKETESAFKAVRVTGLSITEVIDAFTALTQSFDSAGVTIENVSDKALGLQERFGVLAKETISFAADLAPVAAQAGFTVEQLEALGAVGQKYSGRSGSSLAEAFGRILPAIQGNAIQFIQLFQQLGDVGLSEKVGKAFQSGNIAEFFEILLRQYKDLSGAQKNYVIELLGGRREAAALIPVLENSGELLNEFARGQEDAGKTSQYFGDLQKTLTQQLAEFGQKLQQIGVQIYESGLKDFLEDTIRLASLFVDAFSGVVGVLTDVGAALGAIPGVGGGLSTLLNGVLLYKGVGALAGSALGGKVLGRFGGAAASATAGSVLSGGGAAAYGQSLRIGSGVAATAGAGGLLARFGTGYASGTSVTTGVAAGIKSAVSTFNWVGLGVTAGTLIAQEFSKGIRDGSKRKIAERVGSDGRISDAELPNISGEFASGRSINNVLDVLNQYATSPLDIDPDKISKFSDVRKNLVDRAKAEASVFENIKDSIPGVDSGDVEDNKNAANAIADEAKARIIAQLEEVAASEEILSEIVRESLEGSSLEGDSEAIGEGVTARREDLNRFIKLIEEENVPTADLQAVLAYFGEEVPAAIQRIQAHARAQQEELIEAGLQILDAEEALAGFESGDVTASAALSALDSQLAAQRLGGFDKGTADQRAAYAKDLKRRKNFQDEVLINQAKALVNAYEDFGGTPDQQLEIWMSALKSGKLSKTGTKEATEGAVAALKAVHDARLAAADTAEEQAQIMAEGTPVPTELRTELIYQYLQTADLAFQDFILIASGGITDYAEAITRSAAKLFAFGNTTWTSAVRISIQNQIKILQLLKAQAIEGLNRLAAAGFGSGIDLDAAVSNIDSQIAALYGSLGNIPDAPPGFGTIGQDPSGAADARKKAADEIKQAELDLKRAKAEGDPLALADIDIQAAQADIAAAKDTASSLRAQAALIRANNARTQALKDIGEAQNDLALAQRGDDPVGAAYVNLVNANHAVNIAKGAAERLQAQAAAVRAQRELADAFADIGIAQLELAQAMANAAGDSVTAAETALEIAKRQLAHIRATRPNDEAAILRAQAQVVASEAALRDTDLAERERAIDVALQLEQITTAQAIQQLQALLQIPKLTQEQIDNLLLKIKSLQDGLSADFRFNLPTNIQLPTAYEARRLNQTATGSGYNDNRVITVTVNAETNADPQAIATAVLSAVGEPNRTGTVSKRY